MERQFIELGEDRLAIREARSGSRRMGTPSPSRNWPGYASEVLQN
jgi:hypothetical protein